MLANAPKPEKIFIAIWLIWLIGCNTSFFNRLFEEPDPLWGVLSIYCVAITFGMLPVFIQFHNVVYVNTVLKREMKGLLKYIYAHNFVFMAVLIVIEGIKWIGDMGMGMFLARISCVLLFWFLAIPLAMINKAVWWIMYALAIYCATSYYKIPLEPYLEKSSILTPLIINYMIGMVIMAVIESVLLSRHLIKQIYRNPQEQVLEKRPNLCIMEVSVNEVTSPGLKESRKGGSNHKTKKERKRHIIKIVLNICYYNLFLIILLLIWIALWLTE